MEHLNDPNYDLRSQHEGDEDSYDLDHKTHHRSSSIGEFSGKGSDYDTESQVGSTTERAASRTSAIDFDDESPYPEVRAACTSVDDPTMPVNTFRMWLLGLFYTFLISALNQFFSLRFPTVYITGIVAQLTALPLGKGLERILPTTRFNTFGYVWSFNPAPFNIKEHVVITVMANVVVGGAFATDVVATQRFFYQQSFSFSYQMMLILSTQLIGFSLGGMLRRFVVWPASMVWPGALVNAALFNTLHKNYGKKERKHMSREKFFCIALACSAVWYWVPGYLWTGLSVFNWICWIAPNNAVVNGLFGTTSGLGMSVLTFDWSMIAFIGSPLVTPWWSEANIMVALVLVIWIICPIIYYTNGWFSKFMPISSYMVYDNTGMPYDPTVIISNGQFDAAKYAAYSPVFMPTTRAMSYGIAFASYSAIVVHTFLWYRHDISRRFKSSIRDEKDVHARLMARYSEVPHWWYGIVGVCSLVLLCVSIEIFPTQLPIYGLFVALLLAVCLSLPLAMLQAVTNQQVGLNVLHELIAGYLHPGKPIANMIFKTVGYIGTNQAVLFSGDMKLGHYMKVPPRIMFAAQTIACFVSCFVVTAVQEAMFANIVDICTPDQKDGFICASTNTLASASLLWGGIGPQRLFGSGAMYNALLWFFLIGALAPIPFYFLARRFPLSFWRYINLPVFFAGLAYIPPASGINYASWAATGFFFNFFLRRYHFRWWMRYNYILSAALDAGVAISVILIFFTVQYPKGGFNIKWWGNTVWQNTADALGTPMYVLNPGETFGPSSWS
jgi:OPT family small oligopeptide transporter